MKTKLSILLHSVITTLFVFSCADKPSEVAGDNTAPIAVTVSNITSNTDNPFISVSGKVQAVNSANLSTRIMGYVNKIHIKIGDKVTKGQTLLSINNSDISAKLAQTNANITEAKAAFINAEKDYKRFKNLFETNSASQKELDDITAQYNMAKARLEGANQMKQEVLAQFSYSNIKAPFSGVVTNKFVNEGDMATPGRPLLEIEKPKAFQVIAMVPESEISQVQNKTNVNVLIKALGITIPGKVTEISSSSKNTGGQYLVKIILDKASDKLLTGMFATVQFPIENKSTTAQVLIPVSVIITKGELSGIYTVSQTNTALLRWLRLGRTYGDKVEVLSGLTSDETYIISSEGKLFNGVKVIIQ